MDKAAIFLCNYTTTAAMPWLENGYKCYSFDTQHEYGLKRDSNYSKLYLCGYPIGSEEFNREYLRIIHTNIISFACAFPPCTDLAVSGAAHFEKKRKINKDFQHGAMRFFAHCESLCKITGAPYFIENPISVISTMYRKPDHKFHPFEYGGYLPQVDKNPISDLIPSRDAYPKKTCLWSGNGFLMPEKKPIAIPSGYSPMHNKLGGKSLKTKNIRSATPRGFSSAVFLANGKIDIYEN